MDPVSALGLAAGVVQLVDFTSKLLSKGYKLYQSADGALEEHVALGDVALNLRELSKELATPFTTDDLKQMRSGKRQKRSRPEKQLEDIRIECNEVTKQLLNTLGDLMVKKRHRKWHSFRQALTSVWNENEIHALERRLERIRKQLDTTLLVCLR